MAKTQTEQECATDKFIELKLNLLYDMNIKKQWLDGDGDIASLESEHTGGLSQDGGNQRKYFCTEEEKRGNPG